MNAKQSTEFKRCMRAAAEELRKAWALCKDSGHDNVSAQIADTVLDLERSMSIVQTDSEE